MLDDRPDLLQVFTVFFWFCVLKNKINEKLQQKEIEKSQLQARY